MQGHGRRVWLVGAVVVISLLAAIPANSAAGSSRAATASAPATPSVGAISYGGPTPSAGPVTCAGSTTYTAAQIVILANGTVYPYGTAPVTHSGSTYTLTEPVQASLLIFVSNAIIDGSNCVVRYDAVGGHGNDTDVEARDDSNVTLEYFNASAADIGIQANDSSGVTIFGSIAPNAAFYGIWANNSRDINISQNNASYSDWGVYLQNDLGGVVDQNQAFETFIGIDAASSTDIRVDQNSGRYDIDVGVDLEDNTNFSVVDNDFSNNQNGSGDGYGLDDGQDTSDSVVGNNFSGSQLFGAEFVECGGITTFADNDLTGGTATGLLLLDNFGVFNGLGNDIQNATTAAVYMLETGATNLTDNDLSTHFADPGSGGLYEDSVNGPLYAVNNVIGGPWNYGIYLDSGSGPTVLEGNQILNSTAYSIFDSQTLSGLEILGNTITADPSGGAGYAMLLDDLESTTRISDNHVSGPFADSVYIVDDYGPTVITDNVLANFSLAGILTNFLDSSLTVTGNDLSSNATTTLGSDVGVYFDGDAYGEVTISHNDFSGDFYGIYLAVLYSGLVVADNFAVNIGYIFVDITSASFGNDLFDGNVVSAKATGGEDGLALDENFANLTIVNNRFSGPFSYDIATGPVTGFTNISDNVAANFTLLGISLQAAAGLALNGNDVSANATSASNASYALYIDELAGVSGVIDDNNATGGVGTALFLFNVFAESTIVADNDFSHTQTYGIRQYETTGQVDIVSNDVQYSNQTAIGTLSSWYSVIDDNELQHSDIALYVYNEEFGTTIDANNASGSDLALLFESDSEYYVTTVQANDFSESSAVYLNYTWVDLVGNNFLGTPLLSMTSDDFEEFYHNNIETGAGDTLNLTDSSPAPGSFNAPLPVGGNFWTGYTPSSCTDGICSPAYLVPSLSGSSGYYDNYPLGQAWTSYAITFSESGLPVGTQWSVQIDAETLSAVAPASIAFYPENLAPVLYSFSVPGVGSFTQVSPASGTVNASGRSISVEITFSQPVYSVTFSETGLGPGVTWYVNSTGSPGFASAAFAVTDAAGQSFGLGNLTNGTYAFSVALSSRSYGTTGPLSGSFTVNGGAVTVTYVYTLVTFQVTFSIAGLPSGSTWSVTLDDVPQSSTGTTITFSEPNGTYTYSVSVPTGYTVSAGTSISVVGSPVRTYLTAVTTSSSSSSSSLSPLLIGGLVAAAILAVVGWALFLRKGGKGGSTAAPSAWSGPASGTGAPPPGAMGGPPPSSPPPPS